MRRVVRDNTERTLFAVVIAKYQTFIGLGTPRFVSVAHGVHVVLTVRAHTVHLLHVVPLAQLRIQGERTVVLYRPFRVAGIGFLRGDKDHTVAGAATVQGGCGRTFQHRHRLDVIRVERRNTVTQVITAFCACLTVVGVVQGYTVDHVQRLVVTGDLCRTTQHDASRTGRSAGCLLYNQTCYTTGKRVGHVDIFDTGKILSLHFANFITQRLAVALDAHSSNDYLGEHLRVLRHRYIDSVA